MFHGLRQQAHHVALDIQVKAIERHVEQLATILLVDTFDGDDLAKQAKPAGIKGRYVRIELPYPNRTLSLAEVQVFSGGQNIAPAEIEEVVVAYADVLDCAVVGVAHELLGEVPALFVVPRSGCAIETEALLAHCRARLSAYKVPHHVHFIQEIPRTGSGKIIRYKLKELL